MAATSSLPVQIKVCGLTRAQDALLAASLGANALGFIFYPASPRSVTPAQAKAILKQVPRLVASVGVFVDTGVEEINQIAQEVGLDRIQLHGNYTVQDQSRLQRFSYRVFRPKDATDAALVRAQPDQMLLLDAWHPEQHGGTGQTTDWGWAKDLACSEVSPGVKRQVILAGGLSPDNVAEAIRQVQPAAVDVASGVEASPGIKDPQRLHAFFQALRQA